MTAALHHFALKASFTAFSQIFNSTTMEAKRYSLIDTHVHIDELADLEGAVGRARSVGIKAIIGVGSDLISNEKVLQIAQTFPGYVFPTVGFHPWQIEAGKLEAALGAMDREVNRCVALGEVGLDFKAEIGKALQIRAFRSILELAANRDRPVIIHARGAWEEALSMVDGAGLEKAVFHWYSGPMGVLNRIIEKGYSISATPALAYSPRHRKAVRRMPIEGLLLETDAPQVYRGIESEPKDLLTSLFMVAHLKGMEPEEVAEKTTQNALELFGLDLLK
jgi:TatD DNase family protein